MNVKFLEPLDWAILAAYFIILMGIGIWASLKRKKEVACSWPNTP